jgi:hypothetical protein
MSECTGYVIWCTDEAWAYEHRPPHVSWHCLSGTGVAHGPTWFGEGQVSKELCTAFCTWQRDFLRTFLPKRGSEVDPHRRLSIAEFNLQGLRLATRLKQELGPALKVLYMRPPVGDPGRDLHDALEINGHGEAVPYFHHPHAGYVVDADYLDVWAWVFRPARQAFESGHAGVDDYWTGHKAISQTLIDDFCAWQKRFALAELDYDAVGQDRFGDFSWQDFHRDGIELAKRLKRELGAAYVVIYSRPFEDRSDIPWHELLVRMDGSTVEYIHKPYWAMDEVKEE